MVWLAVVQYSLLLYLQASASMGKHPTLLADACSSASRAVGAAKANGGHDAGLRVQGLCVLAGDRARSHLWAPSVLSTVRR